MKNTYNEGHLADKSDKEIENTLSNTDLIFNKIKLSDFLKSPLYFDFKNFINLFLGDEEAAKNYLLNLDEYRLNLLYMGLCEHLADVNTYDSFSDGYREKVNKAFEMLEQRVKSIKIR